MSSRWLGVSFWILAALLLRGTAQWKKVVAYAGGVVALSALFTFARIVLPGALTQWARTHGHTFSQDPIFIMFGSISVGIWLLAPFVGLCLYLLSRFLPREGEAHGGVLLFSVLTFVFGVPATTLYVWVIAALWGT